jgi:16S rRNA (uracil1498-N3)-methyltransferase
MRLHRFYIPQPIGNETEITIHSAELVHQVRRVFRLKEGDSIIFFTGTGFDYECKIAKFGLHTIISTVTSISRSRFQAGRDIILAAAVVKKDTFEWIVEKATELGVSRIIPIMAERSEKKSLNESRLKKIAIEASEQSGRSTVPEILPIASLEDVLDPAYFNRLKRTQPEDRTHLSSVAFHTEGELLNRREYSNDKPLVVYIGPEGGWSDDEIDMFHKNDIPVRSLGNQILRAETAVIAALSQVVFPIK